MGSWSVQHLLVFHHLAQQLHLVLQRIVGHHQHEVDTGLRFTLLTRKQMEHDGTTEGNDCRALTQFIHRLVHVLHGFQSLLFQPLINGFSQTRSVDEPHLVTQQFRSLTDGICLLLGQRLVLRNLRETGVGHFRHEYTTCQTVLHIFSTEAAVKCSVGAEDGPVVGCVNLARLSLVGVVVLSPLTTIEGQTVDIILGRPIACAIRLQKGVEFLTKRIEGVAWRILETLQQRGARNGDGHLADRQLRNFLCTLVGLAQLVFLLDGILLATGLCCLLFQWPHPSLNSLFGTRFTSCLTTNDERHQPQMLTLIVGILHLHLVGIGSSNGHHGAEHIHAHWFWSHHHRLFQS